MALNGISELATKELRQKAKLDLAATNRAAQGNLRATYDIGLLPTQYNDNDIVNNPNAGGLVQGRPWIETVSTFTFYEAFGTTATISTTQYVSGNKIYAESSSYDVSIPAPPARVVVNDIEVLRQGDAPNPLGRGHNLVVLDSYGDVVTGPTQYDTYIDPDNLTTLASALDAVDSGNIVVLVAYDASALNAAVRTAINTGYGSTNSDTWTPERRSHIFIGEKI
jgi:type II secretory pathway pseudopilin PulG